MRFGIVKYLSSDQDVLVVLLMFNQTKEVGSATMPELLVHGFSPLPSCHPGMLSYKIEEQVCSSKPARDNRQQWTMVFTNMGEFGDLT